MSDQGIVQQPVDFGEAAQDAFVERLGFAASNLARDIPPAGGKILVPAGFGLTVPERLVFQPDRGEFRDIFKTDNDVAEIRDRGMAVVEVELFPELLRGMTMDPVDAGFDRVGLPAVARQGIGGLLRRHRRDGDYAAARLILIHRISIIGG